MSETKRINIAGRDYDVEVVESVQDRLLVVENSPAGKRPPEVPMYLRLYPDSEVLVWKSNTLFVRQREFTTRSALVHLLLEQLQLVVNFAAQYDGKGEPFPIEELQFELEAQRVFNKIRKYKFKMTWPLRGVWILEECLDYGIHRWLYHIEVGERDLQVRPTKDVTEAVKAFATQPEQKKKSGKDLALVPLFERPLDIGE